MDGQPEELFVKGIRSFLGLTPGLLAPDIDVSQDGVAGIVEGEGDDVGGPVLDRNTAWFSGLNLVIVQKVRESSASSDSLPAESGPAHPQE